MARYPEVFWLFAILLPMTAIIAWRYFSGIKSIGRIGGEWRINPLRETFMVKWFFSSLGFLIFTAASILALAGFPGPVKKEPFKPAGYDVIYVIDISRSMLASDILPSRLEKAKGIIHSISDGLETEDSGFGNRYGLVVFRGQGSRIMPLTEDRGSLYGILEVLTPDIMSSPGTNIASGLKAALDSFVSGSETGRHVILFTDGEDLEGDSGAILNRFREDGIEFSVIGLGTEEGAFIPLAGGERVRDSSGRDVVTRLDMEMLEQLAEQGGGIYLDGDDSRLLETLFDGFYSPEGAGDFVQVETELFRLYLLLALAGIVMYQAVGIVRWKES